MRAASSFPTPWCSDYNNTVSHKRPLTATTQGLQWSTSAHFYSWRCRVFTPSTSSLCWCSSSDASEFIVFFSSCLHVWENTTSHRAKMTMYYKTSLSWSLIHCPILAQIRKFMLQIITTKRFVHASAAGAISSGSWWEEAVTAVTSLMADGSLKHVSIARLDSLFRCETWG